MQPQDICFSTAQCSDINEIMNIEIESFSQSIIEKEEVFLERIEHFPDGFLLAQKKGKTIGYISSEIWDWNENIYPEMFVLGHSIKSVHHNEGTQLYISSMGTLSAERQQGLGNRMVNALISSISKSYPQISSCILIVSSEWAAARSIYHKNGFKEMMIIKNFFATDDFSASNGIVMRKKIR